MVEAKSAFIITGAGYGINILVLGIIAGIIWIIGRFFKKKQSV